MLPDSSFELFCAFLSHDSQLRSNPSPLCWSRRTRLRWVIARIPFDPVKAWPVRRGLRVRGEHCGLRLSHSLFAFPGGEGHILLVNKKMLAAAKAAIGSQVRIRLNRTWRSGRPRSLRSWPARSRATAGCPSGLPD